MARYSAIIVGSGPSGSAAAWVLANAGYDVMVLEKGPHVRPGVGEVASDQLGTRYSSDEVKTARLLGLPDPLLEPNTGRTVEDADSGVERRFQGLVAPMGSAVGGTAQHYNAKMRRFWRQDFKSVSLNGPISGSNVADWPIGYDDLAPYYDRVEHELGIQGDITQMPKRTLEQSPYQRQFPMPPSPNTYAASLIAEGAARIGWQAFPLPAAVNSETFNGRPRCNGCGLCSGFGCPVNARNEGLVTWLNPAILHKRVELRARAFAHRITLSPDGRRATGVIWRDVEGRDHQEQADVVIVAGSPINTARLLLLSADELRGHPNGLGNRSDQLGRNLMLHTCTQMGAAFMTDDIHGWRGQSTTMGIDETVGPYIGPETRAAGVEYVRGGYVQLGASLTLLQEAVSYYAGQGAWGQMHKQLMRQSPLRARLAGAQLVGEDLPMLSNRVDLDPGVKDVHGFPVSRVTFSHHIHDKVSIAVFGPRMQAACQAAPGAIASGTLPFELTDEQPTSCFHQAGTARMGTTAENSVCDQYGRIHELDNVYVADSSVFPTFPGFNPTETIMAFALRQAEHIVGSRRPGPPDDVGQGQAAAGRQGVRA